jgi:hypothetical protein
MFDEVDEGTAIFKVTDTPPPQGSFATMEGKPSDFYLRLTGEGTRMLRDKEPPAGASQAGTAKTGEEIEQFRLHPEAAQAEAVRLYPDLGTIGTPLNQEFTSRYKKYRVTNPAFFDQPDWPIRLAKECAESLPAK